MPDMFAHEVLPLAAGIIVATVMIAVVTDIRYRKIFNLITLPAMCIGIVINSAKFGLSGLLFSVSGLLLGAALFLLPVAFLGRGAGDLKLLAAVGALGGPAFVFWAALWTGVAGGIFAVCVLIARRRLGVALAGMVLDVGVGQFPEARTNIRLPYALPIAVGSLLALLLA